MADVVEWHPGAVYVRHHLGASSYVQEHQCWNTQRFITSLQQHCSEVNETLAAGEPRHRVEIVTRDEYETSRGRPCAAAN